MTKIKKPTLSQRLEFSLSELSKQREITSGWVSGDTERRKTLTKLLLYHEPYDGSYTRRDFSGEPMSWMQIAFYMGELRSDAEYTLILQQVNDLKIQKQNLENKIYELQNPQK